MQSLSFTPTVSDPCLYDRLNGDGTKVYIIGHVDDLGTAANNKALTKEVVAQIKVICQRVEGKLDFYLGMKVVRDRDKRTITIFPTRYLENLRAEFGITGTKSR